MAAAISTDELKALQQRVSELERLLREMQGHFRNGTFMGLPRIPDRNTPLMSDEEFHRSTIEATKEINRLRKADLKKVMAEYDRKHGRKPKASAGKRRVAKARKAG